MSQVEALSQRALERRLKRHLWGAPQRFFAPCAPPFERVLMNEVQTLPDVSEVETLRGGVAFTGPFDTLYHANLHLRTAHRVLLRVDEFLAQSYPMLFNKASKLPWERYLGFNKNYSVIVSAKRSRLRHHQNIADTLHAGLLEAVEPLDLHPKLTPDAPINVHVRLFEDRCTLSLDTSGAHLHKRGYRQAGAKAPIRETLAAGLLMTLGGENYDLILDPMCGAGTFLIEGAMLAKNIAPGAARDFAFEHFPSFQPSKWERFRKEARASQRPTSLRLVGSDLFEGALRAAEANAERAGVAKDVTFLQGDARSLPYAEFAQTGRKLLLSNLPYGRRVGTQVEVKRLYVDFATQLRRACGGWDFAFVTPHPGWLEKAGLTYTGTLAFSNGGLNVSLVTGTVLDGA